PIRADILSQTVRPPRTGQGPPLKLLVVGGSLGAKAINDIVPNVLAQWDGSQRLDVSHQTGKRKFDAVSAL
ncbi:glycosyltransferase, partial [Marinomonas arenicola]